MRKPLSLKRSGWEDERSTRLDRMWRDGASMDDLKTEFGVSDVAIEMELHRLGRVPAMFPSRYWGRYRRQNGK